MHRNDQHDDQGGSGKLSKPLPEQEQPVVNPLVPGCNRIQNDGQSHEV